MLFHVKSEALWQEGCASHAEARGAVRVAVGDAKKAGIRTFTPAFHNFRGLSNWVLTLQIPVGQTFVYV